MSAQKSVFLFLKLLLAMQTINYNNNKKRRKKNDQNIKIPGQSEDMRMTGAASNNSSVVLVIIILTCTSTF